MASRYAGIDWASETHDVLVADEAGDEVLAATYAHDEKGLTALCRMLVRLEVVLVAVERPDGRLLDAGLQVLALHPNKVAAARDRFRVSGGKSDRFDAFVLCELARTDHHRFRVLEPESDQTKAIRALTRAREDLVKARTGIMNQLRAELEWFWPGPLTLFSHMDAEILLAFLERYPSPADAHGLGVARMQAFLVRERYSGGQHPTALMAKLRSAPRARVGELELAARRRLLRRPANAGPYALGGFSKRSLVHRRILVGPGYLVVGREQRPQAGPAFSAGGERGREAPAWRRCSVPTAGDEQSERDAVLEAPVAGRDDDQQ